METYWDSYLNKITNFDLKNTSICEILEDFCYFINDEEWWNKYAHLHIKERIKLK